MLPVVVGANASKSIPEKSTVVDVDDDVVAAFGSTAVVTSGAPGTSVVGLVGVVVGAVVVDVVDVVDVVVVVVVVVAVVVVVVVAGTRSG